MPWSFVLRIGARKAQHIYCARHILHSFACIGRVTHFWGMSFWCGPPGPYHGKPLRAPFLGGAQGLVSLECTRWKGFFWRMPKQAYTVPCRASHPRGQGAQVLCT